MTDLLCRAKEWVSCAAWRRRGSSMLDKGAVGVEKRILE